MAKTQVSYEDVIQLIQSLKDSRGRRAVADDEIQSVTVESDRIELEITSTLQAMHARETLKTTVKQFLIRNTAIDNVDVRVVAVKGDAPSSRPSPPPPQKLEGVKHVIAVASGKGGVGKSTTAVNLAFAIKRLGHRVALLDADIYGPSLPLMVGHNERPTLNEDGKILPVKAHGVSFISMGLLTDDKTPVIWRGPMVHKMIQQFLRNVSWGEQDFLIIDLPPGTGDAQLSLTQSTPLTGAVIVTTPQEVSLLDARKGLRMFQEVGVPVFGIVENMSVFVCSKCGHHEHVFGDGGGKREAETFHIPFLGAIPLDRAIMESADSGVPVTVDAPDSSVSKGYLDVANKIIKQAQASTQTRPAARTVSS